MNLWCVTRLVFHILDDTVIGDSSPQSDKMKLVPHCWSNITLKLISMHQLQFIKRLKLGLVMERERHLHLTSIEVIQKRACA